jgi:hypothetical protein
LIGPWLAILRPGIIAGGRASIKPPAQKKALVLGKMDVLSCFFVPPLFLGAFTGKPFRFKEKNVGSNIGVIIGVIVLLISIGFVALMMVSEWSVPEKSAPKTAIPAGPAAPASKAKAARKPASKKKAAVKAPAKKKKVAKKAKA